MILFTLQNSGALWRMCSFEKISQFLQGGESRQMVFSNQRGNNRRDREPRLTRPPGVAAAPPAILVLRLPDAAELVGEALTPVAVTGHTPVPVKISPQFILAWMRRQRRLGERIVGRRGRNGVFPRNRCLEGMNCKQGKQGKEQDGRFV